MVLPRFIARAVLERISTGEAVYVSLFSTTDMASTDSDDVVTTKLLTLLNTSATKVRKRKCGFDDSLALPPVKKMGGKRVMVSNVEEEPKESEQEPKEIGKVGAMVEVHDEKDAEGATTFFLHSTDSVPRRIHRGYMRRSGGLTLVNFYLETRPPSF